MQVLLEWNSIVTPRKPQYNTAFADSESVFYTCFLSVRVCAVPRARLSAYQRCWYVNVSTVPAAGRRLVLVPLRISWLYSG